MPDIDSIVQPNTSARVHGSSNIGSGPDSSSPRISSSARFAAPTSNAALANHGSRRSSMYTSPYLAHADRRRSSVLGSSVYDPTAPAPGEMQHGDRTTSSQSGDLRQPSNLYPLRTRSDILADGQRLAASMQPSTAYHDRAPSLGELHQELEQEQEAQVNRLLSLIQNQQTQLRAIEAIAASNVSGDSLPPQYNTIAPASPTTATFAGAHSPFTHGSLDTGHHYFRRSHSPSHNTSPALRPVSAGMYDRGDEFSLGSQAARDDTAFYQAETQNLTRENQMLRQRIRELERQLGIENNTAANSPITRSNLVAPPLEADSSVSVLSGEASDDDKEE